MASAAATDAPVCQQRSPRTTARTLVVRSLRSHPCHRHRHRGCYRCCCPRDTSPPWPVSRNQATNAQLHTWLVGVTSQAQWPYDHACHWSSINYSWRLNFLPPVRKTTSFVMRVPSSPRSAKLLLPAREKEEEVERGMTLRGIGERDRIQTSIVLCCHVDPTTWRLYWIVIIE